MNSKTFVINIAFFCFFCGSLYSQERDTSFFYEFGLKDLSIQDQELISIGTRTGGYLQIESLVPVDIIEESEIMASGQVELSQVLTYILPSFNANHQTISDGTDHIVPASLRGLGPDQILVFVNGKRRHCSSLVNVNGTFGRGAVSTDFDAIPLSAIKRIEILRDGASAQYGSDAIAGVVNIVLKDNVGLTGSFFTGKTIEGDGERQRFDINYGVKIGANGYLNITAEALKRGKTNRSGNYTGNIYHDTAEEDLADPRTELFNRKTMNIGNAQAATGRIYYNLSVPLRQLAEFYAFGGVSFRNGSATGFYRFPKDDEKVVLELYEDGFLPEINAHIKDQSVCFGVRQHYKKWDIDISTNYGKNTFDFNVRNSNNASMGVKSPLNFYCGGFLFSQITTNFDVSRAFRDISGLKKLNIALGAEYRFDNFSIIAGEEASYYNGQATTTDGQERLPGAQLFSGFQQQNELNENRYSTSFYVDVETDVNDRLSIEVASNFVGYSDWGNNLSGKIAARFKLSKAIYLRSGLSTGFRSSSLQQSFSTNVSTQIIDGKSFQVGTFNKNSLVTKALGIPELTEEKSLNNSVGLSLKPFKNTIITTDYYYLKINNRIVLSGRFNSSNSDKIAEILNPFGVNSAQFFTNAINTSTTGINIDAIHDFNINSNNNIKLSVAYNCTKNTIIGTIKTSEELEGNEDILFNREERSRIENAQPLDKLIVKTTYKHKKFVLHLKAIRFGEVMYVHPENAEQDQIFSPKWVTNLSVQYNFSENLMLRIGGTNIFNVYPDKHTNKNNEVDGQFLYSRRVTQFGFNGAFYYTKVTFLL